MSVLPTCRLFPRCSDPFPPQALAAAQTRRAGPIPPMLVTEGTGRRGRPGRICLGRCTPPVVGIPDGWKPGDDLESLKGPIGALVQQIPVIAPVLATCEWKVGLAAEPHTIEPISQEELLARAKPSTRRRLVFCPGNEGSCRL